MRHLFSSGILFYCLMLMVTNSHASSSAVVTNGNNDGSGSLRAALESGASSIRISRNVKNIIVTETLSYAGKRRLTIEGKAQTIDASAIPMNDDILSIENGANLSVSNLSLIGNYDQVNQDASSPEGGKGIYVGVPIDKAGLVRVSLSNVSVTRVGNHGIHISDCTLGDDCASGSGGGGDGSGASIYLKLNNVLVNKVGFGKADADGVRVDDRGQGSIFMVAIDSTFLNVGADGIELDEGNDGSVVVYAKNTIFDSNGEYCNLIPFVEDSPCDDDGDADVDDGFDIDEAGDGNLYAYVLSSKVTNNFDEGLDFDEEDAGDIVVELDDVFGAGNADEAVKMSEENDGDIRVYMSKLVTVDNNGDGEGAELEEADDGNVDVTVVDSNMVGGSDEQLKLEQDDDGSGIVTVVDSNVDLDLDGVTEL